MRVLGLERAARQPGVAFLHGSPMLRLGIRIGLVALALALAIVPLPARTVEHLYSRGFYASIQPHVTALSNLTPFAWFDVLVLAALLAAGVAAGRSLQRAVRGRPVALWHFALGLATAMAVAYLVFLAMWGLNYQRLPLTSTLVFNPKAARPDAVRTLAAEAVDRLNALHGQAHREGFPGWDALPLAMGGAFQATIRDLEPGISPRPGVPKWSLFSYYFDRTGISGMTDPFVLEVLVDRGLLPFERPFVTAHEWAHLAGFANEGEANFIGWLTCLNAGAAEAYSGWLYLYGEAIAAVPRADRPAIMRRLAGGPRADLLAIAERGQRIRPLLRTFGWRVYDTYLRANRVSLGVASYDQILVLVLGTQYAHGWTPLLREPATRPPG